MRISRTPKIKKTKTIGINQYFFLAIKNLINSIIILIKIDCPNSVLYCYLSQPNKILNFFVLFYCQSQSFTETYPLLCSLSFLTPTNSGKMYEGEWVDGSPKCGAYSNIPMSSFEDAYSRSGYLGNQDESAVFELPSLSLARSDVVLGNAVSSVRRSRAAERGEAAIATSTGVFTQDEIDQLKRAFDTVDREETGTIPAFGLEPVLRALGMDPIEEDIEALLA